MSAKKFLDMYGPAKSSILDVTKRWGDERAVDDFLGTRVAAGVLVVDLIRGQGLGDGARHQFSDEFMKSFEVFNLKNFDSTEAIRDEILRLDALGDKSIQGLISALQGRIGELHFKEAVGGLAKLASKSNQESWDVVSFTGDEPRYFQVKTVGSSGSVIEDMQKVEEKVRSGLIEGEGGEIVKSIDFAVNSEIFEDVKSKAASLGLSSRVVEIGSSRSEIREGISAGIEEAKDPLDSFFIEILGTAASATAVHAAVNGFLMYKGSKSLQSAAEDTGYSSLITGGGIVVSYATEKALISLIGNTALGPLGWAITLGAGIGGRVFLRRALDRRAFAQSFEQGNLRLQHQINSFTEIPVCGF